MELIEHEIEVLEMVAGRRPGQWGAWVHECLEALVGAGYIDQSGTCYALSNKGHNYLLSRRSSRKAR